MFAAQQHLRTKEPIEAVTSLLASANHSCRAESPLETSHYAEPINVMTVREVSVYLQVHPSTMYRLLKRHEIPAFQVGSDWRFNIQEIDRWRLAQEKLGG